MSGNLDQLLARIDQEIALSRQKLDQLQKGKAAGAGDLDHRLQLFEKACDTLKGVWRPRLEALKRKFGEKVQIDPQMAAGRRSAAFSFTSPLAQITLTFTASTDVEVKSMVLDYRLELVPILMTFRDRDRLEQPLEKVDAEAVATWIEDRIVDFVKSYMALHENEFYLKAHLVEDPVAHVRFPRFAAAASLERDGKTLYFISNETRKQYEKGSEGAARN
jgi:YHS domain-containing protein